MKFVLHSIRSPYLLTIFPVIAALSPSRVRLLKVTTEIRDDDAPKGRSILVPSVQELSKDPLSAIPSRYLHHNLKPASVAPQNQQLPVISLASLLRDDDPSQLHKFLHACRHWGFFQVVNHGVSSELIERFKVESRELFEMPMEEKIKYWQKPEDMEGFGQIFVVSDEQKLDWTDSFFLTLFPLHLKRHHLLPLLPLPFRETLESYPAELKQLAMKIFDYIVKDLKIDFEYLRGLFEQGKQSMRMGTQGFVALFIDDTSEICAQVGKQIDTGRLVEGGRKARLPLH